MAKPVIKLTFKNRKAFEVALDEFVKEEIPKAQLKLQKKIAIDLLGKIIEKNPVGNPDLWKTKYPPKGYVGGRSRGNWQISVGASPPNNDIDRIDPTGGLAEAAGFADISVARPGQTIWIYNNVRYIKRLEDGWSKQAPLGMVAVSLAEIEAGLT